MWKSPSSALAGRGAVRNLSSGASSIGSPIIVQQATPHGLYLHQKAVVRHLSVARGGLQEPYLASSVLHSQYFLGSPRGFAADSRKHRCISINKGLTKARTWSDINSIVSRSLTTSTKSICQPRYRDMEGATAVAVKTEPQPNNC